jgi:REP element-mobilizing transposase RayT
MSTYTKILYQIVFGSKDYTAFLNTKNQSQLFAYMAGIIKNKECYPYIIGGHSNHIHLLTSLHSSISLADLVREVKTSSNRFMKDHLSMYRNFPEWQVGYGAFTYEFRRKEGLVQYINNQDSHHRKITFKEELIGLLKEFGIDYDERYLLI